VSDAEIREVWSSLRKPKSLYTEARVFSCAVSAYENNGEVVTKRARKRAREVMQIVWPENTELVGVPLEIEGTSKDKNQIPLRQADFIRLKQEIQLFLDQKTGLPTPPVQSSASTTQATSGSPAAQVGAGFGDPAENKLVEEAAVKEVLKHYAGWSVRDVQHDKCGFDLVCTKDAEVEQVEVKGVRGTELFFSITVGEVKQARENPNFVLIVVTSALSPSPILTKFSGAEFVQQFDLVAIQYRASPKQ
jgi:Domain of unknown function (DUF3883)